MKDIERQIITAIDIGTTKIYVVIAAFTVDQPLEILGIGKTLTLGMKKGLVIDVSQTAASIKKAVEKAEDQAGIKIYEAYVGITGNHIRGLNNTGVINVSKNPSKMVTDQKITEDDKDRVLEHAKSVTLPMERKILHVLPQEFEVDNHCDVADPIGMTGHRLEAKVHLVTILTNNERNLETCLDEAGIEVTEFVFQPLASSFAVCDPNEKELGVALLDIGGGTTDVIVYYEDGVRHTGVVPFGGEIITSDIARCINTTLEQADYLKCQYGIAKESLAKEDLKIPVTGIDGYEEITITQKDLASIIEPRMREILTFALSEIQKSEHHKKFTFGVILTGGGSQMTNIKEVAQEVFQQNAKIGRPLIKLQGISNSIDDPTFSTVLGLLQYAIENNNEKENEGDLVKSAWKFYQKIKSKVSALFY